MVKQIDVFLEQLEDALNSGEALSKFSVEGVDFLYDHYDELESEAPITNNYLQTSDFIDDLDGYDFGIASPEHFKVLKIQQDRILDIYREEGKSR